MRWDMVTTRTDKAGRARVRAGSGQPLQRMARWVRPVVWTLVMLSWTCLPFAEQNDDFGTTANDLARQLAQRFPHLEGEVVDVQGSHLYVSLGARDQVLEGMRLDLFSRRRTVDLAHHRRSAGAAGS